MKRFIKWYIGSDETKGLSAFLAVCSLLLLRFHLGGDPIAIWFIVGCGGIQIFHIIGSWIYFRRSGL